MNYEFAKITNYEDFSSGRVFKNQPGIPNFSARLTCELVGRCIDYSEKKEELIVYDCCCGGGYMLAIAGFFYQQHIKKLVGSDINEQVLSVARDNLSLLKSAGIDARISDLEDKIRIFDKESHKQALQSGMNLKAMLQREMLVEVFKADVLCTNFEQEQKVREADLIIVDVPYGHLVSWKSDEQVRRLVTEEGEQSILDKYSSAVALDEMMNSLAKMTKSGCILGVVMDKKQKLQHVSFTRLEKQQIGKRKFVILKRI